jgi:GNAT superfamily N-acetyltransferase
VSLEVVTELAPREDHCVEQLLDLRITRLCLGQNLADVIYWPLEWQGVPLLRALYYDDSADHLSGRGDIEVQRLAVLRRRKNRGVGERLLQLVKRILGLDGPGEVLVFL